jgi:cyclophilin family peptidyl-prolyl cis-trans isomerase/HEAT repeat protein
MVGVVRGLESLLRLNRRDLPPSAETVERLYSLTRFQSADQPEHAVRVRRLALAFLGNRGFVDPRLLRALLNDTDVEVRRLAVTAASALLSVAARDSVITEAAVDFAPSVRYAALEAHGRQIRGGAGCERLVKALDDPDDQVTLLAINLLGNACGGADGVAELLAEYTEALTRGETEHWHRPAHALVALARVSPGRAIDLLPRFMEHELWWLRLYAARAGGIMGAVEQLEKLAFDRHDNVRAEAVSGIWRLVRHEADSIYIQQLGRVDYQLVITAAQALEGSPNRRNAVPALLTALERITAERRETSRDARRALLERLEELAGRQQGDYLASYLRDFDPAIAEEAARILASWTGRAWEAQPQPLAGLALPSYEDLRQLADTPIIVELRGGGSFELRMLPFEAPTNAWRFAWLGREGYFDGLTFHRVVPGFVVQGGSPGANEYVGAGPYTRDEVVKESHLRGTVGTSTRGRDTGDAQIFVNLVDNPRLDHNYTIFAEVVSGMEAIDGILEGAVIERVVVR